MISTGSTWIKNKENLLSHAIGNGVRREASSENHSRSMKMGVISAGINPVYVSGQWKDNTGKKHSTEWLPYDEWLQKKKEGIVWWVNKYPYDEPNYRCVHVNEWVLEDDSLPPDKQKEVHLHYAKQLEKNGVSGEVYTTGGKGLHIQTLWDVKLNAELIEEITKKTFPDVWGTFDKANWRINNPDATGTGRMLGRENQPHRNTGKFKTLIYEFGNGSINKFPKNIFNIIEKKRKEREEFFKDYVPTKFKGTCGICKLLTEKRFPDSSGVHTEIVKHFVVLHPDEKLWKKAAAKQDKQFSEFSGWSNWMIARNREFSCNTVRGYAEKNGLGKACELCPHRKLKLNDTQWKHLKQLNARRKFKWLKANTR